MGKAKRKRREHRILAGKARPDHCHMCGVTVDSDQIERLHILRDHKAGKSSWGWAEPFYFITRKTVENAHSPN